MWGNGTDEPICRARIETQKERMDGCMDMAEGGANW